MRLQDFMTKAVDQVPPTLTAEAAYQRMRMKGIHHLVVMDGREVLGVLSEGDLGGSRVPTLRNGRTVADIMTRDVVIGTPDMLVRRAANLMRGHSFGCLPVIDRGRLVGIVTASDLLDLIGRGTMKPIAESERWTLHGRGPAGSVRKARPVGRGHVAGNGGL